MLHFQKTMIDQNVKVIFPTPLFYLVYIGQSSPLAKPLIQKLSMHSKEACVHQKRLSNSMMISFLWMEEDMFGSASVFKHAPMKGLFVDQRVVCNLWYQMHSFTHCWLWWSTVPLCKGFIWIFSNCRNYWSEFFWGAGLKYTTIYILWFFFCCCGFFSPTD